MHGACASRRRSLPPTTPNPVVHVSKPGQKGGRFPDDCPERLFVPNKKGPVRSGALLAGVLLWSGSLLEREEHVGLEVVYDASEPPLSTQEQAKFDADAEKARRDETAKAGEQASEVVRSGGVH